MKILGIIPARFASTRFPAKALADIQGKSMVQRVFEQANKSSALTKVIIATDNEKILNVVKGFGGEAYMTDPDHKSGTDRCFEALKIEGSQYDFVINIQGDEPFINPEQIDILASCLKSDVQIATLAKKITDGGTLFDTNVVKVIFSREGQAIYFSREALPHCRGIEKKHWLQHLDYFKHIGIYAYHTNTLKEITGLPQSGLEKAESLEQLRWIENGYTIQVAVTEHESIGIDTPEDLKKALKIMSIKK